MDLKTLYKKKGYTATKLAYKLGTTESQVYGWARRRTKPSLTSFYRLIDLLGPEVIECFREEAPSAK